MAFEKMVFGNAAPSRPDVAVAISGSRRDMLRLRLSVSAAGAEKLAVTAGQRFAVLWGTGGDAGTILLRLYDAGPCQFKHFGQRGGGAVFAQCGWHASFDVPRAMTACTAMPEKDGAIVITLPDPWPEKPFSGPRGRHARGAVTAVPAAATAATSPAPLQVTENGITISFEKDQEQVCHGQHRLDVTARQALALRALAKKLGQPVGRSWLMNELWPGKSAADCHRPFDQLIRDLTDGVKKLGLQIVFAGTGYTLMRAKGRGAG